MLDIEGSGWHKENALIELNTDDILVITEDESRYRFDKWSGSIESNDRNIELLVNGPKLIYADYILQYKITRIIEPSFIANIITLSTTILQVTCKIVIPVGRDWPSG